MGQFTRFCFQTLLKLVNSCLGFGGIAMICYSLWMLHSHSHPIPSFIYTILGLGITLCIITCSGHIAAQTANGCCLCIYMVFIFLLFVLEAAFIADIFLNRDWEEDFPEDPTGYFDQIKGFIRQNFDICKWIGLTVVALQGVSMFLAVILKALGPHPEKYYESDDDYLPDRVPLLKSYVQPQAYFVSEQSHGPRSDSWDVRINSKANK